MATVNGKITTCDRCGALVFSACTGEVELDGGFTRWNTFEPLPEGWENHFEVGMLCPKCNDEYKSLITTFKRNAREVEE